MSQVPAHIFREYDIRGIADSELAGRADLESGHEGGKLRRQERVRFDGKTQLGPVGTGVFDEVDKDLFNLLNIKWSHSQVIKQVKF